jgi:heptaprenyl diphosphate synthase
MGTVSGGLYSRTRRMVFLAMLVCLAVVLSYVERLFPLSFTVPGIKLGLANLVVVTGLYLLPPRQALLLALMKCFMTAWIFGSFSAFLYSLAGSLLSFGLMSPLVYASRRRLPVTAVSAVGAIGHNLGQLLTAAAVVGSLNVLYYLPALTVAGAVTGVVIGFCARSLLSCLAADQGAP